MKISVPRVSVVCGVGAAALLACQTPRCNRRQLATRLFEEVEDEHHFLRLRRRSLIGGSYGEPVAVGVQVEMLLARHRAAEVVSAAEAPVTNTDGVGSVIRRRLCPDASLRASGIVGIRGVAFGVDALLDADLAIACIPGADSGIIRGRDGAVYWFVSARGQHDAGEGLDLAHLTERYTAAFGEPLQSMVRATRDRDIRLEALADREPSDHWGHGRVTLLGDAAHPMLARPRDPHAPLRS